MFERIKGAFAAFKDTMQTSRDGVGGLLIILCSGICAFAMMNTLAFVRDTNSRSVAESVEHIVALHVLATAYTSNFDDMDWLCSESTGITGIGTSARTFYPLKEFNSIMTRFRLMEDGAGRSQTMKIEYRKGGHVSAGTQYDNHPTVRVQASKYVVYHNSAPTFGRRNDSTIGFQVLDNVVLPDPMQAVIENS